MLGRITEEQQNYIPFAALDEAEALLADLGLEP
jgi:hypothetical protein